MCWGFAVVECPRPGPWALPHFFNMDDTSQYYSSSPGSWPPTFGREPSHFFNQLCHRADAGNRDKRGHDGGILFNLSYMGISPGMTEKSVPIGNIAVKCECPRPGRPRGIRG